MHEETEFGPKQPVFWSVVVTLLITCLACSVAARSPRHAIASDSHEALLALFRDWRAFQKPKQRNGLPDYTPAAMAQQYTELANYRERLAAIDTTGWPVPQRIDYVLVWAEMNGLEFDHRVRKPWANNPGFYAMVWPSQSDTPAHEGPVIANAIELWQYTYPLSAAAAADLTVKLRTVPRMLEQAKRNLTGQGRDLWQGGIRKMRMQVTDLDALAKTVSIENAELQAAIREARTTTLEFVAWLEQQLPSKTAPSGVGKKNYNWLLKYVYLLPYTWEQEVNLQRREFARSLALLELEEHHNRKLPPVQEIASAEEYDRRLNRAVDEFIAFLEREDILAVKDYMAPALRAQIGRFVPPEEYRHFFAKINHLAPMVMRTHQMHWIELARMAYEPLANPIRQGPLLYNIWAFRSEGLATAMEEMLLHAGLFDETPRAREMIWILVAQRAARALGGLYVQSNDWTVEQAVEFATSRTPRGWFEKDGALAWFEQDLYLAQPGYGSTYLTGKAEMEKLLAAYARKWGEAFSLKQFFADLNATGVIPPALIRWELTGKGEEVERLLAE